MRRTEMTSDEMTMDEIRQKGMIINERIEAWNHGSPMVELQVVDDRTHSHSDRCLNVRFDLKMLCLCIFVSVGLIVFVGVIIGMILIPHSDWVKVKTHIWFVLGGAIFLLLLELIIGCYLLCGARNSERFSEMDAFPDEAK